MSPTDWDEWACLRRHGAIFLLVAAIVCIPQPASAAGPRSERSYNVTVDKDVRIPMRDGSYLVADVYRPEGRATQEARPRESLGSPEGRAGEKFPVLMSLSAYLKELQHLPHGAPFTHQERPEPDWWVPRGYILVFVDTRGTGKSPGKTDIWSAQEARDYYDAIEWAACNHG